MNPPAAPVGCSTCGAHAGARCMTGLGTPAVQVHAARARAVAAWHEPVSGNRKVATVTELGEFRKRRKARAAYVARVKRGG